MKSVFLAILGLVLVHTASAVDRYLYWMVSDELTSFTDFDAVKIAARNSSGTTYLNLYNDYPSSGILIADQKWSTTFAETKEYAGAGQGFYAALAEGMGADNYTYVIELFKGDNCFAESAPLSAAKEYLYVAGSGTITPAMLQMPTSYAVPEPNSALLMVLGCAALALRRRKQTKA